MPVSPSEGGYEAPGRLPRRIAGGFRSVADDLDRRSRDWTLLVRQLDQHRLQLESADAERDRLYEVLARVAPEAVESGRSLRAMMENAKAGDISGDLAASFTRTQRSLDDLESVAEALTNNLIWMRSVWEQYARGIIKAQKMREDIRGG